MIHYLDALLPDKTPDGVIELGTANQKLYGAKRLFLRGLVPHGPNAGKFAYATTEAEQLPASDTTAPEPAKPALLLGCNIGAGGMGSGSAYGTNYVYPSNAELALADEYGMDVLRVPYKFYRVYDPADRAALPDSAKLLAAIDAALAAGKTVIASEHGFGSFFPLPKADGTGIFWPTIKLDDVPVILDLLDAVFAKYKAEPRFVPSLVNEPHRHDATAWTEIAQALVNGMRERGWRHTVIVSSPGWSGLHSLKGATLDLMAGIKDPLNNLVIDVHQYFDDNNSGTRGDQVMHLKPGATVEQARGFIDRHYTPIVEGARAKGLRLLLGEFAFPDTEIGRVGTTAWLAWMEENADVIVMATWWVMSTWMPFTRSADGAWYGLTQVQKVAPSPLVKRLALAA